MKTILSLAFLSLSVSVAACAGSSATDTPMGAASSPATAAKAEPAADLSGTWAFALASSDVAAPVRDKCAKSSGNDAAKTQTCWNEIATQAAMEKIRFGKDTAGHTVWTSFETDGSKENVYVQVAVELAADGPGHVLAKVSGTPKGDQAAQFVKASVNAMRIEVIDDHTIAMLDPKKGRLVYTKE